jgi:hypothetical protein
VSVYQVQVMSLKEPVILPASPVPTAGYAALVTMDAEMVWQVLRQAFEQALNVAYIEAYIADYKAHREEAVWQEG